MTLNATAVSGRRARDVGMRLQPRWMSIWVRTRPISSGWRIRPPMFPPGAVSVTSPFVLEKTATGGRPLCLLEQWRGGATEAVRWTRPGRATRPSLSGSGAMAMRCEQHVSMGVLLSSFFTTYAQSELLQKEANPVNYWELRYVRTLSPGFSPGLSTRYVHNRDTTRQPRGPEFDRAASGAPAISLGALGCGGAACVHPCGA
jgi:hypothetical protein